MEKQSSLSVRQANNEALACGRSLEEQVETVRRFGNHAAMPVLRSRLLSALGIARPKEKADICVIFGCYRLFSAPFQIRDYLRLLDLLHVDYTYLDQEYCCGAPFLMQRPSAASDMSVIQSSDFKKNNVELAQGKGANKLAYCCITCAHAARNVFQNSLPNHVYMPDLIIDALEYRQLYTKPMTIAYFEGCHTFAKSEYPNSAVDWKRYRTRLGEIQGLTIIDIPNNRCCKNSSDELINVAIEMKVEHIVCSCNSCATSLAAASRDKVRIMTLPELLLRVIDA